MSAENCNSACPHHSSPYNTTNTCNSTYCPHHGGGR